MSVYQFDRRLTHLLEGLSLELGIPKTQVVRRAVALLRFAEREWQRGNRLVLTDGGVVVRELVR